MRVELQFRLTLHVHGKLLHERRARVRRRHEMDSARAMHDPDVQHRASFPFRLHCHLLVRHLPWQRRSRK
jgi:hypothetical protein